MILIRLKYSCKEELKINIRKLYIYALLASYTWKIKTPRSLISFRQRYVLWHLHNVEDSWPCPAGPRREATRKTCRGSIKKGLLPPVYLLHLAFSQDLGRGRPEGSVSLTSRNLSEPPLLTFGPEEHCEGKLTGNVSFLLESNLRRVKRLQTITSIGKGNGPSIRGWRNTNEDVPTWRGTGVEGGIGLFVRLYASLRGLLFKDENWGENKHALRARYKGGAWRRGGDGGGGIAAVATTTTGRSMRPSTKTTRVGNPAELSQGHKRASGPRVQARRVYYQAGLPIKRQQL
uniref:Uncharacterized protein n=1 Tax=Vespula pensylvanica TaxID=30213 RepID=A0A834NGM6_VESPE|nr:hypothetical protein H0235_014399 [Vespula pensylvanica]